MDAIVVVSMDKELVVLIAEVVGIGGINVTLETKVEISLINKTTTIIGIPI